MIYIALIITISYLALIGLFIWGFDNVNDFRLQDIRPETTFSVVVPFRNEAHNLPSLLQSIETLVYPKHLFEIIFVDDDSLDESVEIIQRSLATSRNNIRIIKNKRTTNSPKKDAITTAIKQAKHHWIITSDADCILPKYWLDSFDAFIQQTGSKCVVAPVKYNTDHTFLNQFQALDLLSLQGVTIGGFGIKKPLLCNGANLGYEKALFLKLKGFDGNSNIASGDDIFFLEKAIKHNPVHVNYLKCEKSTVSTSPEVSWRLYIQQRVRWASKTRAYNNLFGKLAGLVVLLMNSLVIGLLVLSCLELFNIKLLLYVLIIKFNIDLFLIYKSASFFDQKVHLKGYWLSFIIYPLVSTYIGLIAMFGSYTWKDRTFK
ncbi:glycosyltransferase family 2 protein [Aestuariivivens insulae]|uniref:glycosyltransferase family 2 protein n=1 Tax=Aestuariivivens insulae TaxID=1621988 RepID=UPI001F59EEFA|nr:glycosyltransferase [Aestuariivivens insulae]